MDIYVRRQVRNDFVKQLSKQLQIQANEGRLRFDNYVKGHYRLARIIAGQATFIDYIAKRDLNDHKIRQYRRPPSWLPSLSMLRQLTRVDYFIIADDSGKAIEIYCACGKGLPPELQTIDSKTIQASQNENFITMLGGHSYIISSVAIKNGGANTYLLLATMVNDSLLASLLPPYQTESQILVLATGYTPVLLASSDNILAPPGMAVDRLKENFLYFGAKIFNYEYADMLITYAHLFPKDEIDNLTAPVLQRQRLQLVLVVTLFTLFFLSIMLWISYRIAVITREVSTFSRESLGVEPLALGRSGNELVVLRENFRLLAHEIRSTNRQQALLLQTVLDAMPAPVFYKDTKGVFQGCNRAFVDYLGKPRTDIVGHTVYDIAPEELADIYYKADYDLMAEGGKQVYETRVMFADGVEHDVIFHKATFADDGGETVGLVGVMLDITERLQAERDRKKIESKLIQAQKMESIGTLAGGIAHDFNNILTAILGYTELAMLEVDGGSQLQSHLDVILNSSNRATDLVRQILTFSRQAKQENKPLYIAPILKEALKMLRASVPSSIEFRQEINESCGLIEGDPVQIHQIIMNLSTNAYHAMRSQGGVLAVCLSSIVVTKIDYTSQPELYPGTWLCLEISDSGTGMENEIVERVFEPYFTTKEKGDGTGLGLAVVHGIVMEHHGHISVHSKVGIGTTFKIYFPELQRVDSLGSEKQQKPLQRGSGNILLVDDEKPILGMLSGILTAAGYDVTSFFDPQEALAYFQEQTEDYDLLITDMTMPRMSGFDLAMQVISLKPNIPVILCTGYSELINKEEALSAGINRYIMKPVSGHELAAVVYDLLS